MTTTTATAKLRFIPEDGKPVSVVVNNTEISVKWVNGAGWNVQARRDGLTIHANTQPQEHIAVNLFNTLVEQYEAEAVVEEPTAPIAVEVAAAPVVKLPAAAKGTTTKVSDPGHTVLAVCSLNPAGRIERGGQPGQADVRLLTSLAKRHLVRLTYQEGRSDARKVVTGAEITNGGRAALDRLTAEDRAAAEFAAKLAVIDTIQIAA